MTWLRRWCSLLGHQRTEQVGTYEWGEVYRCARCGDTWKDQTYDPADHGYGPRFD